MRRRSAFWILLKWCKYSVVIELMRLSVLAVQILTARFPSQRKSTVTFTDEAGCKIAVHFTFFFPWTMDAVFRELAFHALIYSLSCIVISTLGSKRFLFARRCRRNLPVKVADDCRAESELSCVSRSVRAGHRRVSPGLINSPVPVVGSHLFGWNLPETAWKDINHPIIPRNLLNISVNLSSEPGSHLDARPHGLQNALNYFFKNVEKVCRRRGWERWSSLIQFSFNSITSLL